MNTSEPQSSPENPAEPEPPLVVGAGFNFSDPNSRLAFLYLRASHVAAIAFLALVYLFFSLLTPLAPTDIWAHLKYGEWIVVHRALPEHEPFSAFSDPHQAVWNFQWLTQVIYYLVFRAGERLAGGDELRQIAGGVEMLRSLHGLLIALKAAFVMMAIRRSTNSLPFAIAGSMLLVCLTIAPGQVQRPQVFGEVFFAFLVWWVSGPRLPRLTWLVVPLLFVLWVNCHGSFVVGLAFFALFWLGRMVESAWNSSARMGYPLWRNPDAWQGLAALLLAPFAVGLLNPHRFDIYSLVIALAQHPNIQGLGEWGPLDFSPTQRSHWLFLATLIVLALSQLVSPRPLPLARLVVLLAFALGPLAQHRMLVWWLILLPWLVTPLWRELAVVLFRSGHGIRTVACLRKTLVALFIIVAAVSWSGPFQLLIGQEPLPLSTSVTRATPWRLALELKSGKELPALRKALKSYPQKRFQGQILVQDNLADFLIWSLPDTRPILVYSHAHVFPVAVWQDYADVMSGGPGWKTILDRYQVNLLAFDPYTWGALAVKVRKDSDWEILVDEGKDSTTNQATAVGQMRLLIALRKHPA